MGRIHELTSILLTLSIDVRALEELHVEHDDNLFLSLADNGASSSERHICTLDRAGIDDAITNLELIHFILREGRRPERVALHVKEFRWDELLVSDLEVDFVVGLFDHRALGIDRRDDFSVECIKSHVNERQRRDGPRLDPLGDLLELTD